MQKLHQIKEKEPKSEDFDSISLAAGEGFEIAPVTTFECYLFTFYTFLSYKSQVFVLYFALSYYLTSPDKGKK